MNKETLEKMRLDVNCINYELGSKGINCNVSLSGNVDTPYTLTVACGDIEFSHPVATYPEFKAFVGIGVGYFLGVFDEIVKVLPEMVSDVK